MSNQNMDDIALEQLVKDRFGLIIDVENVIAHQIPVSPTAKATVFLTRKKQLFCFIIAQSTLALADVKKILSRMGLRPELYVPPKGRPHYFDEIGREHFISVFPGRSHISSDDLTYYRTLAHYNPALVQISEIPEGIIRQYDADARGGWRPSVRFAYRRIRTS